MDSNPSRKVVGVIFGTDHGRSVIDADRSRRRGEAAKAPTPKRRKVARVGQDIEPGTIIRTRSGAHDYEVQADGSRRKVPAGSITGRPELWAPKLASRAFVRELNAPAAEPGVLEKIYASRNSQEAAALMLRASRELTGASSGTRAKWRKAVRAVEARELHARLNPSSKPLIRVA